MFRQGNDKGDSRKLATPEKEVLSKNLKQYSEKWQYISNTTTGESLVRESFQTQITNLLIHIDNDCLSNIPAGFTTSINESLHEKINALFAGAKMGPLAIALLTVFFYSWNSRRNHKIRGLPVSVPLESNSQRGTLPNVDEKFGFGCSLQDPKIYSFNKLVEQRKKLSCVINKGMKMLQYYRNLKQKAKGICGDWFDYVSQTEIIPYLLKNVSCNNMKKNSEESSTQILNENAKQLEMEVIEIEGDGDCLFNSTAFAVESLLNKLPANAKLCEIFKDINITRATPMSRIAQTLREEMVKELKLNEIYYKGFLKEKYMHKFQDLISDFMKPGVFAGDLGDLMIKALANCLHIPFVVLTTMKNFPIITIFPEELLDDKSNISIYVAFTSEGAGHYNALVSNSQSSSTDNQTDVQELEKKKNTACTCGMNVKVSPSKQYCCHGASKTGRTYRSRCPCLRLNQVCNAKCKCRGCSNPHGVSQYQKTSEKGNRKRSKADFGLARKSGVDFMVSQGEEELHGKWTDEENFLILQIILEENIPIEESLAKENVEKIVSNFNNAVSICNDVFGKQSGFSFKTKKQVEGKLAQIIKKKQLNLLVLEEQIQRLIKEHHKQ